MESLEFTRLLTNNSEFLKPFALTLTKNQENARDLVQDTLLKAWDNREKYKIGSNIKGWLYTIMRNIFINDYHKNTKKRKVIDARDSDTIIFSEKEPTQNIAENNLNIKNIYEQIEELPIVFKEPFLLYVEGYKYQEIADLKKEALGTVKSRIFFARKLLKEKIQ